MLPEDMSAALNTLGLSPDDVAHVTTLLTDDADEVESLEVWTPVQSRFGQSPHGQQMAAHAALAGDIARDAILGMSASLQQYVSYLHKWEDATTEADALTGQDLLRFRAAVGRLTAPSLSDES